MVEQGSSSGAVAKLPSQKPKNVGSSNKVMSKWRSWANKEASLCNLHVPCLISEMDLSSQERAQNGTKSMLFTFVYSTHEPHGWQARFLFDLRLTAASLQLTQRYRIKSTAVLPHNPEIQEPLGSCLNRNLLIPAHTSSHNITHL